MGEEALTYHRGRVVRGYNTVGTNLFFFLVQIPLLSVNFCQFKIRRLPSTAGGCGEPELGSQLPWQQSHHKKRSALTDTQIFVYAYRESRSHAASK